MHHQNTEDRPMAYIHFDSSYAPCGFLIVRDGYDPYSETDSVLIQTDWDFPGVATSMGWPGCHDGTDGTIECPECGKPANEMIAEAYDYIADNAGLSFDALDEYLA